MSPKRYSAAVILDLDHAEFPHGEDRGYQRGCRRDCCRSAHAWRMKRTRCGVRQRVATPGMAPHLQALVQAAGSPDAIARRLGVPTSTMQRYANGDYATMNANTARALMALTPDDVAPRGGAKISGNGQRVVHKQHSVDMLRRLQAAGHPLRELGAALGAAATTPHWVTSPAEYIAVETADAVQALYDRLEYVRGTSDRARSLAARLGYYEPRFYDEDGQVDLRSIPEHPWAKLDDRCARNLLVAQALLADHQASRAEVAAAVGVSDRHVHRLAQEMGLLASASKEAVAAAQHRYAADVDAWHDNRLDTVHAAFRTGLVATLTGSNVSKEVMRTLTEHPGYRAWLAEQDARAQRADAYEVAA